MTYDNLPLFTHRHFWTGLAILWAVIFCLWFPQMGFYQPPFYDSELTNGMNYSEILEQHSLHWMRLDSPIIGLIVYCAAGAFLLWKVKKRLILMVLMIAAGLLGCYIAVNALRLDASTILNPVSSVEFGEHQYNLSVGETWRGRGMMISSSFLENLVILSECDSENSNCYSKVVSSENPMITPDSVFININDANQQLEVFVPSQYYFDNNLVFTLKSGESLRLSP